MRVPSTAPPAPPEGARLRVCLFGSYNRVAHPRVAVLEEALRSVGVDVVEANVPAWAGGTRAKLRAVRNPLAPAAVLSLLGAWARLVRRYRGVGRHDVVLVGYFGHLDVHLARLLAGRRRVVLDMFLSVYETGVVDRGLVPEGSLRARLARAVDRRAVAACRLALLDTQPHVDFCVRRPRSRCACCSTAPSSRCTARACWPARCAPCGARASRSLSSATARSGPGSTPPWRGSTACACWTGSTTTGSARSSPSTTSCSASSVAPRRPRLWCRTRSTRRPAPAGRS